jgi:hypothetical protein
MSPTNPNGFDLEHLEKIIYASKRSKMTSKVTILYDDMTVQASPNFKDEC